MTDTDADDPIAAGTEEPIVLFDGVCNLCTTSVRWIVEHDRKGVVQFASLQSDAGQELLERFGLPTEDFESMLLVEGDTYYEKSDAAVRLAYHLGFPWSLGSVGSIVPKAIRDRIYDWVAANRYDWFGQHDSCMRPTPELQERFLE
ncbi:MAG: thiol-disulfide oxidoreductase DCC family protein [Natronomonas sp.]